MVVYILFSGKEEYELSSDEIQTFNKLIGKTEFSFFQSLVKPVVVFDYYEQYTLQLISELCDSCGMQCNCSVDYSPDANADAFCFYEAGRHKIVICEGTVLSIYRYASILSCLYKIFNLNEDDKYIQRRNFVVHSITSNGNIIDTSIIFQIH